MKLRKTGIEPLDEYCEGVMSGDIPVCKWVRLAVERHYNDLERAENDPDFPYYFEPEACLHYVNFFRDYLQHFDGIHKGEPIIFEPWQYFVWGSPFGWLKEDRLRGMPIRRFRVIIIIIPKKQGKSIIIAGTMLYMLDFDEWPGAQIYALAKNRSHAEKLGYRDAEKMVKNSEILQDQFKVNKGAAHRGIYCEDRDSFVQPLTSKPDSTDGLKVHMAANDEVKDWTDFEIYNVMKDGTAANPNSLIANITTAGDDRSSLGYDQQEKLKKILNGVLKDEQTFGVIFTIDEGKEDDPEPNDREKFTEALASDEPWKLIEPIVKKANPNYGVSVGEDYYKGRVNDAKNKERDKNNFLTKHLNVWVNAMSSYFDINSWINECSFPELITDRKFNSKTGYIDLASIIPEKLTGKPCYLHLDMSSKKDICSLYSLFRYGTTQDGKKRYATVGINFLPEAVVSENLVGRRSEYNAWAEQGHFVLTPGNATDLSVIEEYIKMFSNLAKVIKVGFDDWNSIQVSEMLRKARIEGVEIKQNTKNLSEPMKTVESHITYRSPSEEDVDGPDKGIPDPRLVYGEDPVLTWAMSNVVAKEDANENVYPRKSHEDSKIDPAVALINLFALEEVDPLPTGNFNKRVPKVWGV